MGDRGAGFRGASLRLEGLLLSGRDIVLRGRFESVQIASCTLDPGTAGDLLTPPETWMRAVDNRSLVPTRLWIEGSVASLTIERSILGPIRTRRGGVTEEITVSDSVIQGLPSGSGARLTPAQVFDPSGLFGLLGHQRDPLTAWLAGKLTTSGAAVAGHLDGSDVSPADMDALVADLGSVISGSLIWDAARFAQRTISSGAVALAGQAPAGQALAALNRRLLAEAFPIELHDAAIATATGTTTLCRTTVLGCGYVHRIECSESILDDVFLAADPQYGCTRFSAWSAGSVLPRKYESVQVAAGSPVFDSRRFGESFYAQVSDGADSAILSSTTAGPPSVRSGSRDGSEMGAFCSGGAAVKERSLLIKLDEYMPVGLTPVLIPMPPFDAAAETKRGRPWPPT